MDIIRKNTDYAFRLVSALTVSYGKMPVSVRKLAEDNFVPYELARKLLQQLSKASLVKSTQGPRGGYELNRSPNEISFIEVIEAIQGKVRLNQCLLPGFSCPLKSRCPVSGHLAALQKEIVFHLSDKKLSDLNMTDKMK